MLLEGDTEALAERIAAEHELPAATATRYAVAIASGRAPVDADGFWTIRDESGAVIFRLASPVAGTNR